jgi:hypothetical protein
LQIIVPEILGGIIVNILGMVRTEVLGETSRVSNE